MATARGSGDDTAVDLDAASRAQVAARQLLDRVTTTRGAAVRASVDSALHGGSTDRVVLAAALVLAHADSADLGLHRAPSKRWALALDELVDCGHVDAAAYAAPRLAAAYPHMPYLEHMALVFRRLPAKVENGRPTFVDDRGSDVQVVPTAGAQTLLLAFCGSGHRLGMSLNLMDRWHARLGCHVVYLRDRQGLGFTAGVPALGPDQASTVDALAALARELGASKIVCTGNSAGASGALRYACELGAERVLALGPITGGPEYEATHAPYRSQREREAWSDLVPLYRAAPGVRARLMYGEKNEGDRQQCLRMAGLPRVTVESIPDWESHHLVGGLLRAGKLQSSLDWLVSDATPQAPRKTTAPVAVVGPAPTTAPRSARRRLSSIVAVRSSRR